MLKRILKSHVSKYIALSLILCSTIYSTTFLSSSLALTTTKETTNLSTIEISYNITDQDIVTSENYDTALQNFIEENNYDYNINTGLNILDEFMKEYDLDCLIRVSE